MNDSSLSTAITAHPEIAAMVVLVLGFTLARLARGAAGYLLNAIDQWLARYSTSDAEIISQEFVGLSRGLVFWVIILASIVSALHLLGINGLEQAIATLFNLIPQLVVALAIVGAGHIAGLLLGGLTARLSESIEPDSPGPRLVHGAVLMVAIVMGLQQLHIDITFITQLLLVLVVVVMGGMAVAFALGARDYVANLIGRSELQRYAPGERIRIGAYEGTIVNIHRTGVEIATQEGVVAIPAAQFSREPVARLSSED